MMNGNPPTLDPCNALERVVSAWKDKYPRRAFGGTWALTGFSFQTAVFLLEFYRNVASNGPLPVLEQLSDVTTPAESALHVVIQVKRTLTTAALLTVIEEFSLIARLCKDLGEATFLSGLRFQVVCRRRAPDVKWPFPSDTDLGEDTQSALRDIKFHHADPFIQIKPDPLEDLWLLLWSHGVRDPEHVISQAHGCLLSSFGKATAGWPSSCRSDLVHYFESAPRRDLGPLRTVGTIVLKNDVMPDPNASSSRQIVVGGGFGFREIRNGCFRIRPVIFDHLWSKFSQWLDTLEIPSEEREIPVFWIDGRSGEGKSVLLRQLIAQLLLRDGDRLPIIELGREDVPHFFRECRYSRTHPVFVMVDDLYAVHDREAWEERILQEVEADIPAVALITCGPTEQREEFERVLTSPFKVRRFTVPRFDPPEYEDFIQWFTARVGRVPDTDSLTAENTLLVQLMFELAEGMSLREFARRFTRRMQLRGANDGFRRILALAALYIATPEYLLTHDELDAINRLADEDQQHFRRIPDSITFAHAHLAAEMLPSVLEASTPRLSWELAWARELASIGKVLDNVARRIVLGNILRQVTVSARLQNTQRIVVLEEIYRLSYDSNRARPGDLLARWLECSFHLPELKFAQVIIDYAQSEMADGKATQGSDPETARWMYMLRSRTTRTEGEIQDLCWHFITEGSANNDNTPAVAAWLLKQLPSSELRRQRALEWLAARPDHMQAYHVLNLLISEASDFAEVRTSAFQWLTRFPEHPQYLSVLASLVAAAPDDSRFWHLALQWVDGHREHPKAGLLLGALVAGAPHEAGIRERASHWLDKNPDHPQPVGLLAALVAGAPKDIEIRQRAMCWLALNSQHALAYNLLAALVASTAEGAGGGRRIYDGGDVLSLPLTLDSAEVRQQALDWLGKNPGHPQLHGLLATLVATAPSDGDIRRRVTEWLEANSEHEQADILLTAVAAQAADDANVRQLCLGWLDRSPEHARAPDVLATLIASAPSDGDFRSRAIKWLATHAEHPRAQVLLATLVARAGDDLNVRQRALDWLDANPDHPGAYTLLAPLTAKGSDDAEVWRRVTNWISCNENHPQFHVVMGPAIARSPDSEADVWIQRGMAHVRKFPTRGRGPLLAVVLSRSHARADIVEWALGQLASLPKREAKSLLFALSRATSQNIENAFAYMSSATNPRRQRYVAGALARGIQRHPGQMPELGRVLRVADPFIGSIVLSCLVGLERASEIPQLSAEVVHFLTRQYRRNGYREFLQQLQRHNRAWAELLKDLPRNVMNDYQLQSLLN